MHDRQKFVERVFPRINRLTDRPSILELCLLEQLYVRKILAGRQILPVGAGCLNWARPDLSGGV
jgi:hypothetical protein